MILKRTSSQEGDMRDQEIRGIPAPHPRDRWSAPALGLRVPPALIATADEAIE